MNSVVSARWGRGAVGSASRWNREGRDKQSVGPWRSWERASMASRRSWVRIPSAPPALHSMSFHVYILLSETTNHYYIGQTQDVEERLAYHNATTPSCSGIGGRGDSSTKKNTRPGLKPCAENGRSSRGRTAP